MREADEAHISSRHGLSRVVICGSVDDGKSTVLGRLLFDLRCVPEDQLAALIAASRRHGSTGNAPDLALLLDGLEAEREQAITIDVAYRYLDTPRRRLVIADAPGHLQYTRNMVTGASTADLAVLLVDARKGVLLQTRRHSFIAAMMGIRRFVLLVNKMDLVDWDAERFAAISNTYRAYMTGLGITDIVAIPVSALYGDNVVKLSSSSPWFNGVPLLNHLETAEPASDERSPFRFAVQWVNRPHGDFRGYTGIVSAGRVRTGDRILVSPSGYETMVQRIVTMDGDLTDAVAGQAVALVLADELDIGRGDILSHSAEAPTVADQFAANVVWLGDEPMLPGRAYILRQGCMETVAQITEIKHRIDIDTQAQRPAKELRLNEIGVCNLSLDRLLAFDSYKSCRDTGAFILIDRYSQATVGAGMIRFGLRRGSNLVWQPLVVDKASRARIKGQRPCILWFTGLSGAGKSTIANLVEQRLHAMGRHTYLLDGDNVRHGLNKDLGFTPADRVENIRRAAETAKLFVEAGLIVLVSFISPFKNERRLAREGVETGEFMEVFVDASLEVCEQRDPKGLYKKARAGTIPNFTGIDSPYEAPENAEIVVYTAETSAEDAAEHIIDRLRDQGII